MPLLSMKSSKAVIYLSEGAVQKCLKQIKWVKVNRMAKTISKNSKTSKRVQVVLTAKVS